MATKDLALQLARERATETHKPYVIYKGRNGQWMFSSHEWFVARQVTHLTLEHEIIQPASRITVEHQTLSKGGIWFAVVEIRSQDHQVKFVGPPRHTVERAEADHKLFMRLAGE